LCPRKKFYQKNSGGGARGRKREPRPVEIVEFRRAFPEKYLTGIEILLALAKNSGVKNFRQNLSLVRVGKKWEKKELRRRKDL
jgi:hypothetical protein